jgi:hypothetical protein
MNIRAVRATRETPLVAKMAMSKKDEEVLFPMGQTKPKLHRYWLQVDRQTKNSFETPEEAEKAAKAIKSAHPKLQVGIYDAEKSQQTLIEA